MKMRYKWLCISDDGYTVGEENVKTIEFDDVKRLIRVVYKDGSIKAIYPSRDERIEGEYGD